MIILTRNIFGGDHMNYEETSLVRNLIPISFDFDAYSSINFPNFREKNFFSDNVILMESHYLKTNLVSNNLIKDEYSSDCPKSEIKILPYFLTLEEYISKLLKAKNTNSDFISLNIKIQNCCTKPTRHHKCKLETKGCLHLRRTRTKISEARVDTFIGSI